MRARRQCPAASASEPLSAAARLFTGRMSKARVVSQTFNLRNRLPRPSRTACRFQKDTFRQAHVLRGHLKVVCEGATREIIDGHNRASEMHGIPARCKLNRCIMAWCCIGPSHIAYAQRTLFLSEGDGVLFRQFLCPAPVIMRVQEQRSPVAAGPGGCEAASEGALAALCTVPSGLVSLARLRASRRARARRSLGFPRKSRGPRAQAPSASKSAGRLSPRLTARHGCQERAIRATTAAGAIADCQHLAGLFGVARRVLLGDSSGPYGCHTAQPLRRGERG